jgi:hypothetical protein
MEINQETIDLTSKILLDSLNKKEPIDWGSILFIGFIVLFIIGFITGIVLIVISDNKKKNDPVYQEKLKKMREEERKKEEEKQRLKNEQEKKKKEEERLKKEKKIEDQKNNIFENLCDTVNYSRCLLNIQGLYKYHCNNLQNSCNKPATKKCDLVNYKLCTDKVNGAVNKPLFCRGYIKDCL